MTVALATADGGEGDLVHDKLSYLRTIGSGFAPLIYEVKRADGYKQLMERCRTLWGTLKENSKLSDILVSCCVMCYISYNFQVEVCVRLHDAGPIILWPANCPHHQHLSTSHPPNTP